MTRVYVMLCIVIALAALAASAIIYPGLPEQIPTHWNIQGEIDSYGSKTWATFLMPGILVGLLLMFAALPWLSPKPFAIDSFRSTYWFIALAVTATMAYIHGLTLYAALAGPIDITRPLLGGLMVMFALMGNVMGKVRRNFYMGIRTPWTLASERVWNDTHRLAGRLFVAAGIVGLIAVLLPLPVPALVACTLVLIFGASLSPVLYSLLLYKRFERSGAIPE